MSDIRFNQWLHNSGTGGISQDSAGHVGIGTTVPTHINALTNNNSILHVGIVSCNTLNAASKIEGAIDDWIIHQSDTNTKFGFPTTDTFAVETAGDERIRITSGGNIEVATTTATSPAYLRFNSNRSNADDALGGIHGIWNGNSVAGVNFKTGADTGNKDDGRIQFVTYTGGSPYGRMMILEDGKIGIGIDNPTSRLYVNGVSTSDIITARSADTNGNCVLNLLSEGTTGSSRIVFSDTAAATGDAWISYGHSDRAFTFTTAGTGNERLRIRSDGRVQVKSGSAEVIAGEGASAELRLTADEGDDGADYWKIQSNHSTNNLNIATYATGAYVDKFSMKTDGDIVATGNLQTNNLSGRNVVINGDMRVTQRGTSASMSNHGSTIDVCDRWIYSRHGVTATVAQVAEAPAGRGFKYSLKWTSTSAVGSIAAGNVLKFAYNIERQDIQRLGYGSSNAKKATLSFWAKGSIAGKIGVSCTRNSRITSHNVDMTANTWEFHEIVIPIDTSTALSGTDTDSGFYIGICWGGGSNSTSGATNGWINFHNAYTAGFTAGQQGAYLTTSGSTFQITGVKFELGSVATPFEHRSYADELKLCQRYYQQVVGHSDMVCVGPGRSNGTTNAPFSVPLSVPLAKSPTINACNWSVFTPHVQANINNHTPAVTKWDANNNVLVLQISGLSGMTNGRSLNVFLASGHTLMINSEL